jgi:membrane fusion protein, copper/silver efflux system
MNMKMKSDKLLFRTIWALTIMIVVAGCERQKHDHTVNQQQLQNAVYSCPMHPEIQSDTPGTCPICKMNLEPAEDLEWVLRDPSRYVLSRQGVVRPVQIAESEFFTASGIITENKDRDIVVASRIDGRIEKLWVRYNWQFVKKGDPVMELYSPSLRTYQQEHLLVVENRKNDTILANSSRQRLQLLGMTTSQIAKLEKTRNPEATITMYSPAAGYVKLQEDNQNMNVNNLVQTAEITRGMQMNTKGSDGIQVNPASRKIKPGAYVNEGTLLYSVNDLSDVWARVMVPALLVSMIDKSASMAITLPESSDARYQGKYLLAEPEFENGKQKFVVLRVLIQNHDNQIKLNAPVAAQLPVRSDELLTLPASAVLRTGLRSFVWRQVEQSGDGVRKFERIEVNAGKPEGGRIPIYSGINENTPVAKSAALLADSETIY